MSSNPHFNLAVASNASLRRVAEGVLIARVADRPGVGPLDISLSYLAVYGAPSGRRDIFWQNVAISHQLTCLRDVNPLQSVVDGDRRAFHSHRIDGNVLG